VGADPGNAATADAASAFGNEQPIRNLPVRQARDRSLFLAVDSTGRRNALAFLAGKQT
jgi:hypothetical protein